MELIVTIIIAVIIKWIKENPEVIANLKREKKQNIWNEVTKGGYQSSGNASISATTDWQKKARENIAKAGERAKQKRHGATKSSNTQVNYEMAKRVARTTPVQEQLNQNRMSSFQRNEKELTASEQIRKRRMQHGHSESVFRAIHNHADDFTSSDILGTVTDLMVKGYEGNLCFARDFLGEAMDMISHFQPPTEIPNYSISEMKF